LMKAKKENFSSMIRLCLVWNRIDIARNYIFTDENRNKVLNFIQKINDYGYFKMISLTNIRFL
jgi:hypothetical protein